MYQPYPTGAELPEIERRPVPSEVRNAVKVMYAGAAASLLGMVVNIVTVNSTKSAIDKHSHLTASQLNATQHTLIAGSAISGVITAALWIFLARNCLGGRNWARVVGTVLFAIATIDTIGAAIAPLAAAVKIWEAVIWLVGLTAVLLLWRRRSTEFFTGG